MATPIGHLLAGQVAYRAGSETTGARGIGLAVLCGLASIAPDLDFIPGLLVGTPALYHQGVSHSIFAGLAFGLVLAILYRRGFGGIAMPWAVLSIAYSSHLLLDLFGPDRRAPYGIPLFWPFSQATFLSPVTLLPGVHHVATTGAPTSTWISETLRMRNLQTILIEIALVAPFVVLAEVWVRRKRARQNSRAAGPNG